MGGGKGGAGPQWTCARLSNCRKRALRQVYKYKAGQPPPWTETKALPSLGLNSLTCLMVVVVLVLGRIQWDPGEQTNSYISFKAQIHSLKEARFLVLDLQDLKTHVFSLLWSFCSEIVLKGERAQAFEKIERGGRMEGKHHREVRSSLWIPFCSIFIIIIFLILFYF